MTRALLIAGVMVLSLGGAQTAAAQNALGFLDKAECGRDGRVAADDLMLALIDGAAPFDLEIARAWDAGTLGTLVVENPADYLQVRVRAETLLTHDVGGTSPEGRSPVIIGRAPDRPVERVRQVLNRSAPWFAVTCSPPLTRTAGQGQGQDGGGGGGQGAPGSPWIIGGSADDAAQADIGDREFAKVSYTDDREAGDEIISVDLYVGSPAFDLGLIGPWRYYASYQRSTSTTDPLNDVAFGVQYERLGGFGMVFGGFSYETDDEFDSALYRADIAWDPGWLWCDGERGVIRYRCQMTLRADYVSVEEVGDKTSLTDQAEYFRLGAGLDLGLARRLANGGQLEGTLGYRLMEPVDGDEGEASEWRAGIKLLPSETANFTVGLEYVNGEDPTSLTPQDKLMIYFGYRR